MNKIIKEQLNKCNIELPEYTEDTTHLFIIKKSNNTTQNEIVLEKDNYYIIEIARFILYPSDNFTLDSNWNKGIRTKSKYMLVTPIKFIGKMICFDGCGYDLQNNESLDDVYNEYWLPSKGFKIVKKYEF